MFHFNSLMQVVQKSSPAGSGKGILLKMQGTMSDLENSMVSIVQVFHNYSGNKCKLRKAELKELINNEMSHFIVDKYLDQGQYCGIGVESEPISFTMKKIQENDTLDQLFSDLDQNGDLEIDFQEFIAMIAMVTSACHNLSITENHN